MAPEERVHGLGAVVATRSAGSEGGQTETEGGYAVGDDLGVFGKGAWGWSIKKFMVMELSKCAIAPSMDRV